MPLHSISDLVLSETLNLNLINLCHHATIMSSLNNAHNGKK